MKTYQKSLLVSLMFISSTLIGCRHEKNTITEIKTQNELHDILTKCQGPIVVTLSMNNCGWCTKMHPIIEAVAADDKFRAISFYQADGHSLTAPENEPSVSAADIVKEATGQDLPGYPFILFMNKGTSVGKQIGGIVLTPEQKAKKVSEQQVFADKIAQVFPESMSKPCTTSDAIAAKVNAAESTLQKNWQSLVAYMTQPTQ